MLKKRHLIAISSDRIQTRYNTSGVEIDKMLRRTGDRLASNIPKATKQWMYEERKKEGVDVLPPYYVTSTLPVIQGCTVHT